MPIKTQHTIKSGDTVALLAKNYQITVEQIVNANPQIFTPDRLKKSKEILGTDFLLIYPGEILNIPTGLVDEIKFAQAIKVDSEDDLTIYIDNVKCPLPHEFEFIEYFDACSDSFSLTYPYDVSLSSPAYQIDIENFKTKGLPDIKLYIGAEPCLSGSVEVVSNSINPDSVHQTLAGRTATFLLEKSDILPSIEREYLNLTVADIANIVCSAYSIPVEIATGVNVGDPFPKVTIEDNEKPFFFLSRLARERGLITGRTGQGKFLIHKAEKKTPVANFKIETTNGQLGLVLAGKFIGVQSLDFTFDTRELFGQYHGKTSTPDDQDLISTVQSKTILQQSIKVIDYSDAEAKNLQSTTEWEEQKAIRDFYQNSIPFPGWINPNTKKRWKAGDYITLEAKEAGIKPKVMLIRNVKFNKDSADKRTAVLNIIPEEVYL